MTPTDAAPAAPPRPLARALAPAIVVLWAIGTAAAFWSLLLADRRPLDPATVAAYFDAARAAPAAEAWLRERRPGATALATVVHVEADGCACSAAAAAHAKRIAAGYAPRRVEVLSARLPFVRATPAALVFDRAGRLVYFGPYSDDADCGGSGRGFVERTLDGLLAGRHAPPTPPSGVGCFCLPAPTRA